MRSLNNRLKAFRDTLTAVDASLPVYHYRKPQADRRYICWQELNEAETLDGNNRKGEQGIEGSIDLFTVVEYDTAVDAIQDTLDSLDSVSWRINSVQYEEDLNLIHYEWYFELR